MDQEVKHMTYDYYYGGQSEQFSFYRIPKVLFTEKEFSHLLLPLHLPLFLSSPVLYIR